MSSATTTVESPTLSVSEYASVLGTAVRRVGGACLEGEVQRVTRRPNGMLWFSLVDGEAALTCKVFSRDAAQLEHRPADGDLVRVRVDRPDFYAAQGSLSLIVSAVSLAGEGELLRRRAALVDRLTREGLCDPGRRRPLPRFPRAVGVIAGANSDGMSDVIRALQDRWPAVHIVTCASAVQGKTAPAQLIDALARLQEHPLVDVIVMARGGGSVQDLACFDDEGLCRALFACDVAVVCAIGHTDNAPVCNHVAWAAFTPSRSAEIVVPSAAELRQNLATAGHILDRVPARLAAARQQIATVTARMDCAHALDSRAAAVLAASQPISLRHLTDLTRDHGRAITRLIADAEAGLGRRSSRAAEQLRTQAGLIDERTRRRLDTARREVSHLGEVVAARDFRARGWLLASQSGAPVRSASQLTAGRPIDLHLHDGRATAVINHVEHNEDPDDRNRS